MKKLQDIVINDFKEAIDRSLNGGHISIAPMGMSGQNIYIHDIKRDEVTRCQQISIRLYCGDPELLITSNDGDFLFYGRYSAQVGVDALAERYFRIFKEVEHLITQDVKHNNQKLVVKPGAEHTVGFDILAAASKAGVI